VEFAGNSGFSAFGGDRTVCDRARAVWSSLIPKKETHN